MTNFNKKLSFLLNRQISDTISNSHQNLENTTTIDSQSTTTNVNNFLNIDDNFLQNFFNFCKIKPDPKFFSPTKESIDLRFETYSYFSEFISKIQNNLTKEELKTIISFKKLKPFKITETDKNTGIAIISNELYTKLVLDHLNNNNTYMELTDFDIEDFKSSIIGNLLTLKDKKFI
jgi:hypothetical protein